MPARFPLHSLRFAACIRHRRIPRHRQMRETAQNWQGRRACGGRTMHPTTPSARSCGHPLPLCVSPLTRPSTGTPLSRSVRETGYRVSRGGGFLLRCFLQSILRRGAVCNISLPLHELHIPPVISLHIGILLQGGVTSPIKHSYYRLLHPPCRTSKTVDNRGWNEPVCCPWTSNSLPR